MSPIIRLDPRSAPLWRDPDTLQFGLHSKIVLHDPEPWQLQVITALETGIPRDKIAHVAIAYGASPYAVDSFVKAISPAFERPQAPLEVCIYATEAVPTSTVHRFQRMLEELGVELSPTGTAIVLGGHVLAPRDFGALVSDDVRHLPVSFGFGDVTVGPVVVPGHSACVACVLEHETDQDSAWPALASQLVNLPIPEPTAATIAEAAALTVRLLRAKIPGQITRSVTVDRAHRRSWAEHHPHANCGCRSLAGNEMALAASDR